MRTILLPLLSWVALWGTEGYEVYKRHCMQCHLEMMDKATTKQRFKSLKAPPMVEVSNRLRENIVVADGDDDVHRHLVTLFIVDYIDNPRLLKSMCHPMALERFGVMPSLKGQLTSEEKQAVADWVYDRYAKVPFR